MHESVPGDMEEKAGNLGTRVDNSDGDYTSVYRETWKGRIKGFTED